MMMLLSRTMVRRCALLAALAMLAARQVGAIYPDDHWSYSTQLTEDNFDSFIETNVNEGMTVFVRWIASPYVLLYLFLLAGCLFCWGVVLLLEEDAAFVVWIYSFVRLCLVLSQRNIPFVFCILYFVYNTSG